MDYIPDEEAKCLEYLEELSAVLGASPAAYGIAEADAANLAARVTTYRAAYTLGTRRETRTETTVQAKDEARAEAVDLARYFVQTIKLNDGVSDSAKTNAGIPLPKTSREPVPVPFTKPVLDIVAGTLGAQTLKFRDSTDDESTRKPYGVKTLLVYTVVAEGPVTGIEGQAGVRPVMTVTRGPFGVPFEPADNGKTATYFGQWVNTRGEQGPMSDPVSMTIAA